MSKFDKVIRVLGIIAVCGFLFLWAQSCSNKKEKHRQEAEDKAYQIAEAIHEIAEYRYEISDMSYLELYDTLYEITEKCADLEHVANEVMEEFAEVEYDNGRESRSWFY